MFLLAFALTNYNFSFASCGNTVNSDHHLGISNVCGSELFSLINKVWLVCFTAYETSKGGLTGGAIAGIVIGGAVLTMAVTALVLFLFYRRRQNLPPALRAQIERCKIFFTLFILLSIKK